MSRICIVTPDTIGPAKNGGIGTHCYNLAVLLARQGNSVSILYTGSLEQGSQQKWKNFYRSAGVELRFIAYPSEPASLVMLPEILRASLYVFETLRHEHFDQIHFQDWQAGGFHCIQAKRTMGCFAETLLTVTAHSNTAWINEGMQEWNADPIVGTQIMWAERYCVAHCDRLISPSQAMFNWLRCNEWELPENQSLLPYVLLNDESAPAAFHEPEQGVIAFFGRLETRKGLKIFCEGLKKLSPTDAAAIRQIHFVGKEGTCEDQPARVYIKESLAALKSKIHIHSTLDSFQAITLLQKQKALAFLPSLLDNLPFSGLECVERGIPAMAANVGGFPEIFPKEQLFEPTADGIAEALSRALQGKLTIGTALYDPERAKKGWIELATLPPPAVPPHSDTPLISVCMAHYNYPRYLPWALDSLERQDYPNFEVIVTDDGSTDPQARAVFQNQKMLRDGRFRFFEKENSGPGLTRNFCANQAKGTYLVFMDADNLADPSMLRRFAEGMERSGVDALTCHFETFAPVWEGSKIPPKRVFRALPLGQVILTGLLENPYGDTNMIVKAATFQRLGGMCGTREGIEDWEFLARLALTGGTQDVVPETLFYYRLTPEGVSRNSSKIRAQKRIAETYKQYGSGLLPEFVDHMLIPFYWNERPERAYSVFIRQGIRIGEWLEKIYQRTFPSGSKRQHFASWVRRCYRRLR
ncbi:glycosyltransferase [Desulfovibrio sp. OttesenSCG-928-I05]|nr:glycosyltransferase [Desulfovibrio sp. OttesenSCG-928-I05]